MRKDGIIGSFKSNSDSLVNIKLKNVFELTSKKWNVAEMNYKKIDNQISILVFIKSSEINDLKYRNIKNLTNILFDKGTSMYEAGDFKNAEKYYSDCEKIFDSYMSQFVFSSYIKSEEYSTIKKNGISSIMNLAVIYYKSGHFEKACDKWRKVSNFDKEALDNFKNYCNN